MHLARARALHDVGDVLRRDAAAWQDLDPSLCLCDQPFEPLDSIGRGPGAARCQYAVHAEANQDLERGTEIEAFVEGAVKRHRQRPRGVKQRTHSALGDLPRVIQLAGDDPVRARVLRALNLVDQGVMLGIGVDEVARPRAHEHEDRNFELRFAVTQQLELRRGAAVREIRAELDPIGAAFLGRERRLQRLYCGFDQDQIVLPRVEFF